MSFSVGSSRVPVGERRDSFFSRPSVGRSGGFRQIPGSSSGSRPFSIFGRSNPSVYSSPSFSSGSSFIAAPIFIDSPSSCGGALAVIGIATIALGILLLPETRGGSIPGLIIPGFAMLAIGLTLHDGC